MRTLYGADPAGASDLRPGSLAHAAAAVFPLHGGARILDAFPQADCYEVLQRMRRAGRAANPPGR